MQNYILLLVFFLFIFNIPFYAVSNDPKLTILKPVKMSDNYHLTFWTTDDGLPQNSINKIIQTKDGYIWLATNDGLVRFDGVKFTVFNTKNLPGLKTNRVSNIIESRKGELWIGTEGEGVLVKRRNKRNEIYTVSDGLRSNYISEFFESIDGRMWIITDNGLNYYENGIIHSFTVNDGLSDNRIFKMYEDLEENLWIATRDNVINRFYKGKVTHIREETSGTNGRIYAIYQDKNHRVWFASVKRLSTFIKGIFSPVPESKNISIFSMTETPDGILWAIDSFGSLYHIVNNKFEVIFSSEKKLYGFRSKLLVDKQGLLWIGYKSRGLCRIKRTPHIPFNMGHGLSHNVILSIHQAPDKTIWTGTNGGGISYYKNGVFKKLDLLPHASVWSTFTDSDKAHWFGTWGGGLIRIKNNKKRVFKKTDGLPSNVILALYEGINKDLWIGTGAGLSVYKNGQFENISTIAGFKGKYVISILEDIKGDIWAGTKTKGLNHLKDGVFENFSTANGLSNNAVRALYEDMEALWIGTYGGGLLRYKDRKFFVIDKKLGLFDNVVSSILEDDHGFLWMSCNRGVFKVKKQELNDLADRKIQNINCIYYNKEDGMTSAECNGGFQPSACKTGDGKLWFPTIKGIAEFDPGRIAINSKPPTVLIEKIVLNGKQINFNDQKELSAKEFSPEINSFEFHYTGLNFILPKRVRFKYKMKGLEENWHSAGTRRIANYNKIPPGKYTFRVKSCNNDGVWNKTGTSFTFYLRPAFYQTAWFYSLCGILILILFFLGFRLRLRKLNKRKNELETIIKNRALKLQKEYQHKIASQPDAVTVSSVDSQFLYELRDVIKQNLSKPGFGVNKLAKSLYMSSSSLNNRVKSLTGETPNQFLMSFRLQYAEILLKEQFGNVTEVALASGFTSSSYFTRCFKKKFQVLPTLYINHK